MCFLAAQYGSTVCRVLKQGDTKLERFLHKNQQSTYPKENHWILRIGVMGSCQKVTKFDFQSQFST